MLLARLWRPFTAPPRHSSNKFGSALGLIAALAFLVSDMRIDIRRTTLCWLFGLAEVNACFSRQICCQNAVVGAYREISPDGTYSAYFPFGELRDMQLMLPFHGKLLVLHNNSLKSLTILHREHHINLAIDDLDAGDIGITCRGNLQRLKEILVKHALDTALWKNDTT